MAGAKLNFGLGLLSAVHSEQAGPSRIMILELTLAAPAIPLLALRPRHRTTALPAAALPLLHGLRSPESTAEFPTLS